VVTPAKAKHWRPGSPLPPLSTRQLTLLALVGELQPVALGALSARLGGVARSNVSHELSVLRRLQLVGSIPQRGINTRYYLWAHVPKVKPALPPVPRKAKPARAADKAAPAQPATIRPASSVWDFAQRVVPAQPARKGAR
jgi:DNA-binding transcriptional ArsR family regulator